MKAYELLDSPEKWTQHCNARNAYGVDTPSDGPDAVCWCLIGALDKCYGASAPFSRLMGLLPNACISPWNDDPSRTFEEVRELLIRADV